jgi:uncharacterized membrane protein YkoI
MKILLFLSLLTSLLMSAAAYADISQQQAATIAQGVYPGRVLAVKLVRSNNSSVYRVKTLSSGGDVHIVVIDASSGSVVSRQ